MRMPLRSRIAPATFGVFLLFLVGCGGDDSARSDKKSDKKEGETVSSEGESFTTPDGLKITEVKKGDGAEAKKGQNVEVHYTGTLRDGKKFDSSRDRNQPFRFKLGAGQVIKGWDEGIAGMKVGGKRILVIPSKLAYGPAGRPPVIPPDAELTFDVELLGVK
jgi:FKBP-type peptidyl-prolyl cis-trans isomerase